MEAIRPDQSKSITDVVKEHVNLKLNELPKESNSIYLILDNLFIQCRLDPDEYMNQVCQAFTDAGWFCYFTNWYTMTFHCRMFISRKPFDRVAYRITDKYEVAAEGWQGFKKPCELFDTEAEAKSRIFEYQMFTAKMGTALEPEKQKSELWPLTLIVIVAAALFIYFYYFVCA